MFFSLMLLQHTILVIYFTFHLLLWNLSHVNLYPVLILIPYAIQMKPLDKYFV